MTVNLSHQETVDWILESCGGNSSVAAAVDNDLKSKKGTTVSSSDSCFGGPLSQLALHRLSILCTSSNSLQGWSNVDADSLPTLIEFLREHVDSAASIDLFREAKTALLDDGHGKSQVRDIVILVLFLYQSFSFSKMMHFR